MKLTIFFNGWGMKEDALPLSFFQENEREVICINYPYEISDDLLNEINKSENVDFFAWSFGVFYLNRFLNAHPSFEKFNSIGINGISQLMPKGMRERVLDLTIKSMNEMNRINFYKKLEIDSQIPLNEFSFLKADISLLKEELVEFKGSYRVYHDKIKSYLLSGEDKILNFKEMASFCENFIIISGGHYPFNNFKNFSEILNYQGVKDEI